MKWPWPKAKQRRVDHPRALERRLLRLSIARQESDLDSALPLALWYLLGLLVGIASC